MNTLVVHSITRAGTSIWFSCRREINPETTVGERVVIARGLGPANPTGIVESIDDHMIVVRPTP